MPKIPKLAIFAIFILLILAPIVANQYYKFQLQPKAKVGSPLIFVIKPGQSLPQIAQNLEEANLIKNALAFRLLVTRMGIAKNIQAGDFRLLSNMTSQEIANELTHGAIDVWVTLPEGLRVEEMAERIEAKLNFPQNDKYQFAKNEFTKLAQEGYMFPDTYLIPRDAAARDVVLKLKTTFDQKVTSKLLEKGKVNNLTPSEVIILASLVEREAKSNSEKPVIVGVLINRINSGVALQVDATVQYAKGYSVANNTWWPTVTTDDYGQARSPFNTYLFAGLPPQPIANPGLASIQAAAEPEDTDYFYYLHDEKGQVHYAKTIDEHNKNIKEYL